MTARPRYISIRLPETARRVNGDPLPSSYTHGVWDRQRQRCIASGTYDAVSQQVESLNERHDLSQARRNDDASALRRAFA
jgi:hypothetical protein